ncbi:hypothetical protein Q1695_007941 [Nippostrongylus brasiliensis]|nr:hypothetical protein Q1695_007941 [Nippostrongylus brasiliensis]
MGSFRSLIGPKWLLLFFLFVTCSSSYRLNVPRVLLPYHPTIPVKFLLEVTQPSGGCFNWRSTRPDVVSVTPLGSKLGTCSDKAEVRAAAKAVSGELSAVIFAEDTASGTMLSCGVTVDQISNIRVDTTNKILFVDAAPARMIVEAFNAEGDKFSTLSEIPVDWELSHSGDGRPLRIVPFEQSTYEAPPEIIALENNKKKGYTILVEGVLTGSATLTARFTEPHFVGIKAHSLELTVVANLLLLPAHDLYLPVHAVVPFQVQIVRQSSTEDVDVKVKTGVRPPSTAIYVVDPETIQWTVSGSGNWLLQTGTRYKLSVLLLDPHGNTMYISDNVLFESMIPSEYFDVHFSTKNNTYFEITPKKVGRAILRSKFVAVLNKDVRVHETTGKVAGEQSVQIVDPVRIVPAEIVLPFLPRRRTSISLKASGGSGLYDWNVSDTTVCSVDTSGVLISSSPGSTTIFASDKRNPAHKDIARVSVMDVSLLRFGETRKEAEVGSDLVLNLELMGSGISGLVPFTDCRAADFRVTSSDNGVFRPATEVPPSLPTIGTGCSTVTLKAVSSGDAKITVSYGKYEASIDVSAYAPLKVDKSNVAVGLGSTVSVRFEGGPRAWLLDPSAYFHEASSEAAVSSSISDDWLHLGCGLVDGTSTVILRTGNKPSSLLPLPAVAILEVVVCCATPNKLTFSLLNADQPRCPSNVRILLNDASAKISLKAHATCGREENRVLDSISGFDLKWSTANRSSIKLGVSSNDDNSVIVESQGGSGTVGINAEISAKGKNPSRGILKASMELRLVGHVKAEPNELVLWNDVAAVGSVTLVHGSGHFAVQSLPGAPFTATVKGNLVTVTPRSHGAGSLRIEDICVSGELLDIPVKVTNIHSLSIYGPQFVEVDSEVEITVDAVDESGVSFTRDHGALSNVVLESTSTVVHVSKMSGTKFRLRGIKIGGSSLKASSPSASGRTLVSRVHAIQVFSPLLLLPNAVTLIPESVFQLEVAGGPQPTPQIVFALNNTNIATVEPNGLISSKALGYTTITGSVNIANTHATQSTVILRVVSLAGIRAIPSTQSTESGARVCIRVNGLDEAETPFSFGGALYPFKIIWTVSHPSVLKEVHPLGASVSDLDVNRFTFCVVGGRPGSSTVKVRVELSSDAKQHFVRSKRVFEDEVDIRVEMPLKLRNSEIPLHVIRIAQNAEMQLETSWPQSTVEFSVPSEYSSRISVSKAGILKAKTLPGSAAVVARRTDLPGNETSVIPVTVAAVNSLDVVLLTSIVPTPSIHLLHFPVGMKIDLEVIFRDSWGRRLSAVSSPVSYRPHRFDITDIVASDANRTLSITLKSAGETVLMIWITDAPSQNVFVRLSATEQLHAFGRTLVVSDVICFASPLDGPTTWFSSGDLVEWLDANQGVAKLAQQGSTHIVVQPAIRLCFWEDYPKLVTNADEAHFVFPVVISPNETTCSHSPKRGCTSVQLDALTAFRAPFECAVAFTTSKIGPATNILSAKAVFVPKIFSYACVVERQEAGYVRVAVVEAPPMELTITAKFLGNSQVSNAVGVSAFHFAMRVVESEVQLSDVDRVSAILSVIVPSYQVRHVTVVGCPGDIVSVFDARSPASSTPAANKFFNVKLNVKAAALWSDLSEKCALTVENTVTGQSVRVPVRIRIVGQAAKQVYKALDSNGFFDFALIFLQHYSWIIPSLMWICALGVISIAGYWFVRRRVWEREGIFNDTTTLKSPSTSMLSNPSVSMQSSPSECFVRLSSSL